MDERTHQPLLPRRRYLRRLLRNFAVSLGLVTGSLGIGTAGYHVICHLAWIDAFLNAAMILTGMGPVDRIETAPGKIFAALYALFSGVAFLTIAAVLFAPVIHRFLHRFHLDLAIGRECDHR